MKRLLLSAMAVVMSAAAALAGDGSENNPYTCAEMKSAISSQQYLRDVWVEGYIVGYNTGMFFAPTPVFSAEGAPAGNLLLSDNKDQNSIAGCLNVLAISNADTSAELSLSSKPENLGKKVAILCSVIEKTMLNDYFTSQNVLNFRFDSGTVGIDDIATDSTDATPVYYSLDGVMTDPASLRRGTVYIEKRGNKTSKIVVR